MSYPKTGTGAYAAQVLAWCIFVCTVLASISLSRGQDKRALMLSLGPLGYGLLVAAFLLNWAGHDSQRGSS